MAAPVGVHLPDALFACLGIVPAKPEPLLSPALVGSLGVALLSARLFEGGQHQGVSCGSCDGVFSHIRTDATSMVANS
jgi:hypothetical protein